MEPEPADSRPIGRRRWQFSLTALFLAMTITCVVLSRFYPHVYVSAHIQIPTMTLVGTTTFCEEILSDTVVHRVVKRCPHLTGDDSVETLAWLRANVEVRHVKKDILEIRMSGRPGDYDRMQEFVDAIAAEYVDHMAFVTRRSMDATIALMEKQHDEMTSAVDQMAEETEEMTDLGMAEKDAQAKLQAHRQVRQASARLLKEWKALRKQSPQVIHRDSGWVW